MSSVHVLRPCEIPALSAFSETLIVKGNIASKTSAEARVVERLDEGLGHLRPDTRFLFRVALFLFQWGALFIYFRPFTRLNDGRRRRYFDRWYRLRFAPLRGLLRILEALCYVYYYSDPQVARDVGYDEKEPQPPLRSPVPAGIVVDGDGDRVEEVEVCVIGSGAGGAVVAAELAEKGHQVLILEEGPYFSIPDFDDNTVSINQKMYRDGGFVNTYGNPPILLPTGCCVGGTTVINSGTCYRTPDAVIAKWQAEGLSSITGETLRPYFERIETRLGIAPVPEPVFGVNNETILRGIQALGFTGEPLARNAPGCKGSGHCIYGCPIGAKQSMERSYIPAALAAGARLYAQCKVETLTRKGDRITEVKAQFYRVKGVKAPGTLTVRAKIVIVACGTLTTPLLLRHNRLGRESGQLGKNLSLHPATKTVGLFEREISGIQGVPQGLGMENFHEEGLLFEGVFLPPSALSANILLPPRQHRELMEAYRHIGIFGFLVSDTSRGEVHALPNQRPLIIYNMNRRDVAVFAKGLALCAEISFAAGAKRVLLTTHRLSQLDSPADIARFKAAKIRASDLEVSAFHPLGTARMGVDPRRSVIDEQLRVHDLANLYIADGSIFPSSLGVNPQESIMAFAARLADHLHKDVL